MLELTVAAAADAQRAGDPTTVRHADRAARAAANELGIRPALLAKMQRDALAALDEVGMRQGGAGRGASPLERQRSQRWN